MSSWPSFKATRALQLPPRTSREHEDISDNGHPERMRQHHAHQMSFANAAVQENHDNRSKKDIKRTAKQRLALLGSFDGQGRDGPNQNEGKPAQADEFGSCFHIPVIIGRHG